MALWVKSLKDRFRSGEWQRSENQRHWNRRVFNLVEEYEPTPGRTLIFTFLPRRTAVLMLMWSTVVLACDGGPTAVAIDPTATIALGGYHACGLSPENATTCWGVNSDGQVGTGSVGNPELPGFITGDRQFKALSLGFAHSCGLTTDGTLHCWGSNNGGRLGTGIPGLSAEPVAVAGAHVFATLSGGGAHTCAITVDSVGYCWGTNTSGQLGLRTPAPDCGGTCAAVPQRIEADFPLSHISAGAAHTCALTPEGAAYCWGSNSDGQLGNGTLVSSPLPVLVQGGAPFVILEAGGSHTCGVLDTGATLCWGRNDDGQLGTATPTAACTMTGAPCSNVPLPVETSRLFVVLSAGGGHTCALTAEGTAHCWGRNRAGQLGNGEVFNVPVPQQVLGGHRLQSVSVGVDHTCAVSTDLEVFCWGDNFRSQLGNGSTAFRFTEPQFIVRLGGSE